jgi:hypothetical protein
VRAKRERIFINIINSSGSYNATQWFKELLGNLLQVAFCNFFEILIIFKEGNYRVSTASALRYEKDILSFSIYLIFLCLILMETLQQ